MDIRILGWGYENIRRFENLYIDLELYGYPHIAFVMMRNGTGKTTTINLFRAILSGEALNWNAATIREYKPPNKNVSLGKFYIKILFGSELYHYNLILNYADGICNYQTTRAKISGGKEDKLELPLQLRGVLNAQFINRFIFDGEQAKKTLLTGSKEAELAVTYLYRIDKLDMLIDKIEDMKKQKQQETDAKGSTSSSVNNNRTRMQNEHKNYLTLQEKERTIKAQIKKQQMEYEELERQRALLLSSNESLRMEKSELDKQLQDKLIAMDSILKQIDSLIAAPYRIHKSFDKKLQRLVCHMNTLQLPKTTAREFFKELAECDQCVCGRTIGPEEKRSILTNAEKYLIEDDLNAINAIKDSLRNYQLDTALENALDKMVRLKDETEEIKSALERLILRLDSKSIEKADELKRSQDAINASLTGLTNESNTLSAPISDPNATKQNNLKKAKEAWLDAEKKFYSATGTYEFTQKANLMIDYIRKVRACALDKLKQDMVQKTNDKISRIITNEKLVVEKIDGRLIIQDRSAVSEGQTLAIAYAYIGSLFEHSPFKFPFIIDSPAASMDLDVRRYVAATIPQLFKQLIIYVTSGEVAGFADQFYNCKDALFLTIEGHDDSKKSTCTVGKEYFASYQSEEE